MTDPPYARRFIEGSRAVFVVLLPISMILGGSYLHEWSRIVAAPGSKRTQGMVVEREMVSVWRIAQRPRLTIQIGGSPETVHAILSMNAIDEIPDRVTFHFSGDSNAEVYLLEERSPLWFALFFLLVPPLALALIHRVLDRKRGHGV